MTAPSGKIPVLLTAVQVDLIGEALVEHIAQLTQQLAKAPQKGKALEEVSLLKAYLELAKIMLDRNGANRDGAGKGLPFVRVSRGSTTGPSPLQRPGLRLRQP